MNQIIDLQNRLIKWIDLVGWVDWSHVAQACNSLVDNRIDLGNYPEYTLFMPLWRNGVVEVAYCNDRLGFSVIWKRDDALPKKMASCLQMLKKIPSIKKQIELNEIVEKNVFATNNTNLLNYEFDFRKGIFIGVSKSIEMSSCGIFKKSNYIYFPSMLLYDKVLYKIKSYQENPDAINVARCFVRMEKNALSEKKCGLFVYKKIEKTLYCRNYSEIPVLVSRALICSDVSQLEEDKYYIPPNKKNNEWSYRMVSDSMVSELKRIFGNNAVEDV